MPTAATLRRRDRTAIAGSIAVHLCVLIALASLFRGAFPSGEPDERPYLTALIRVEHHPTPAPQPHRVVPVERTVAVATPPPIHAAKAVERAIRALVQGPENRAPVRRDRSSRLALIPAAPAAIAMAQPTAPPTPAATPVATAAPAATSAATAAPQVSDGIGNFGESYPASVDPDLRSAFFSGIAGRFDVRITVDEGGRATAIEFVRGPDDPVLRDQLRARLLAARFIPAACNGLRCAGTVELRN